MAPWHTEIDCFFLDRKVFFVDADQEAGGWAHGFPFRDAAKALKAHQLGIWGSPAMLFYARRATYRHETTNPSLHRGAAS